MVHIVRLLGVLTEEYSLGESMNQFTGRAFTERYLIFSEFLSLSNNHWMDWLGDSSYLLLRYVSAESVHPSIVDERKSSLGVYSW